MQEFNEGDLVQAAKGRQYIVGYLNSDRDIVTENVTHTPAFLRNNGWTVTVIEKAAPKLPTEPGYYFPKRTFVAGIRIVKFSGGVWRNADGEELNTDDIRWLTNVHACGDLTRLEPVPVTTKQVAEDFVAAILAKHDEKMGNTYSLHVSTLMEIAATFGVEA